MMTAARGRECGMQRRDFLKLSIGSAAAAALASPAIAQGAAVKEIRIGYQKTGVLVITRQQRCRDVRKNSDASTAVRAARVINLSCGEAYEDGIFLHANVTTAGS